jgi:hypothetical protein
MQCLQDLECSFQIPHLPPDRFDLVFTLIKRYLLTLDSDPSAFFALSEKFMHPPAAQDYIQSLPDLPNYYCGMYRRPGQEQLVTSFQEWRMTIPDEDLLVENLEGCKPVKLVKTYLGIQPVLKLINGVGTICSLIWVYQYSRKEVIILQLGDAALKPELDSIIDHLPEVYRNLRLGTFFQNNHSDFHAIRYSKKEAITRQFGEREFVIPQDETFHASWANNCGATSPVDFFSLNIAFVLATINKHVGLVRTLLANEYTAKKLQPLLSYMKKIGLFKLNSD